MSTCHTPSVESLHVLHYQSLSLGERSYDFPCDGEGHVHLDQLTERQRNDYFYARVVVGNSLAAPNLSIQRRHAAARQL
jgi:hypothetical protein